ncbi:MAG: MotA/TolQ/ExbB proton channel family protein [Thiotrichaceae bacterium]|nr:MotA/TolQ/ExbB proton channel family protein [Thiotrichaceae bacterium]
MLNNLVNLKFFRLYNFIGAIIIAALFIGILPLFFDKNSIGATILLDYHQNSILYPFSVQNIMWVVFFIGLSELWLRYLQGRLETYQLYCHYLPEDEKTVLQAKDLGIIYKYVRSSTRHSILFLPRLIQRIILQFQTTQSVSQANTLLNSSLELYMHEIDLRYNMLRYITWLIPTLGFIGTVIGISDALHYAGAYPNPEELPLSELTARLSVAFYTTLLALLQAAILVFCLYLIQAREEMALNRAGQYCLDNLINRLYCP